MVIYKIYLAVVSASFQSTLGHNMWLQFVASTFLLLGVQSWRMSTPHPVLRFDTGGSVTVMCHADVLLGGCEVRTTFTIPGNEHVIPLGNGHESRKYTSKYYNASYSGRGLDKGDCGVRLSGIDVRARLLICRGLGLEGGWKEQQVILINNDMGEVQVLEQPRVTALPGTDVSFMVPTSDTLTGCDVFLPGTTGRLNFTNGQASPVVDRYRYSGTGLARGECGVTISGVTDKDSGVVWVLAVLSATRIVLLPAILIVAAVPSDPLLLSGNDYIDDDLIEARCSISNCAPVPNITWYLGGQEIRSDQVDDLPELSWRWPWDVRTVSQMITHKTTSKDDGEELICRIDHVAMEGYRESKETMSVKVQPIVCGIKGPSNPALIVSNDAWPAEYPWQAFIYIKQGQSYVLRCGGTLLSETVVISAASCFWNDEKKKKLPATFFQVGVGKVLRSWTAREVGQQKSAVKQILALSGYSTDGNKDIAMVILRTPVFRSRSVNFACIDWTSSSDFDQRFKERLGLATTWSSGYARGVSLAKSEVLQIMALKWLPNDSCPADRPTFMNDKLCAGAHQRGAIHTCREDTGGGLFLDNGTTRAYYLTGVLTGRAALLPSDASSAECYVKDKAAYTKLSSYARNFKKYLDRSTKKN